MGLPAHCSALRTRAPLEIAAPHMRDPKKIFTGGASGVGPRHAARPIKTVSCFARRGNRLRLAGREDGGAWGWSP